MKHAVLIQAHKNPSQVGRLCRRLQHPDLDIYINIDARSDERPFREEAPGATFISQRTPVRWGSYSQVEATLRALRQIMQSPSGYGHILFISGQDYPVIPVSQIVTALDGTPDTQYLSWIKPGFSTPYEKGLHERYRYLHFHTPMGWLNAALNRISKLVCPNRRSRLPGMEIYKGSNWWNLTGGCVAYILKMVDENPDLVSFFRRSQCPDELFFHTVIMNSPLAAHVVNDNKRFVVWEQGSPNPLTLTAADAPRILSSGKWFARKIDPAIDSSIPDILDLHNR